VPGDKSIAHRALMLAAIASGESRIQGVPDGEDVGATVTCLRRLGIAVDQSQDSLLVTGRDLEEWPSPTLPLDCRNSGTTMRLLAGLLAGSRVTATLTGDASLSARPMDRVAVALRGMGGVVRSSDGRPPLQLEGRSLYGIHYTVRPPSAQVKSAILLAGLQAAGETVVEEAVQTRNHTERLLSAMGARLVAGQGRITLQPLASALEPIDLSIPGDISSGAFLLAAASLRPGWSATIEHVGLNPTRTAFIQVLRDMGAEVVIEPASTDAIEPYGRVTLRGRSLAPLTIDADRVALAIDEIPIILVLASQASGTTTVDGVSELRVKESDRVRAMAIGLSRMGAHIEEAEDRVVIHGPAALHGAQLDAAQDHRIAMALAVAGLVADGPSTIVGASSAAVSYPGFFQDLRQAVRARH
jgi:3-phosphoshikimate 1-carboxyvinyltransferase